MSKKNNEVTQSALNDVAVQAQDLSFTISDMASALQKQILTNVLVAEPAAHFNQLIEACASMNRALLAIQRHREDIDKLKADLKVK